MEHARFHSSVRKADLRIAVCVFISLIRSGQYEALPDELVRVHRDWLDSNVFLLRPTARRAAPNTHPGTESEIKFSSRLGSSNDAIGKLFLIADNIMIRSCRLSPQIIRSLKPHQPTTKYIEIEEGWKN